MCDGGAEERQDAVAGQLRDRAAEALDRFPHQPDDVVEEKLRAVGAERLRKGCRADDVGDEHRHDSPLADGDRHV